MASPYFVQVNQGYPQAGQQPGQPPKPYNLQNTAAADPYLQEYLQMWRARAGELKADEGRLRSEHDSTTKGLISQARGDISDSAAGAGAALSEDLARRGVAGAGVEAGQRSGLSEASQREQARASTNIALTRNADYENQRMARQRDLNAFISGGLGAAGSIGARQLDAQGLGLQQYQVMNDRGDKDSEKGDFVKYFQQKQQTRQRPSIGGRLG